jgi:Glycosyl transferase family 90
MRRILAYPKTSRWMSALILSLVAAQVFLSARLGLNGSNHDGGSSSTSRGRYSEAEYATESRRSYGISDRMARDLMDYAIGNIGKNFSARAASARTRIHNNNHTFPRWGDNEGIDMDALVRYIRQVGKHPATRVLVDPFSPFTEIPFVVDASGVYLSLAVRNQIPKRQIRHRIFPVQRSVYRSWRHLIRIIRSTNSNVVAVNSSSDNNDDDAGTSSSNDTTTTTQEPRLDNDDESLRWPNLIRAVQDGGFPFVLWEGDFRSCNYRNFLLSADGDQGSSTARRASVPLFTTCAHVNCSHAWPFPTYETISELLTRDRDWENVIRRYHVRYPWHSKTKKLLWRGSLSGPLLNYTSPRARIALFAAQHRDHPLLDIGLHSIPSRHWPNRTAPVPATTADKSSKRRSPAINFTALLGPNEELANFIPSNEFARYAAILDTDGNSWSSRFGRLLCSNSVVLKVEPQYVDYFYKYLEPWGQYVPVREDLSDLLEKVEWALHPRNADQVQGIISRANQFCIQHMLHSSVTRDILDIFEAYVTSLDRHDPQWSNKWQPLKRQMLSNQESYRMQRMTGRKCQYTLYDECYVPDQPPPPPPGTRDGAEES